MNIHQVFINDDGTLPDQFPEFSVECTKSLLNFYPEANYHLYSGKEMEDIISQNFEPEVYRAYKKLNAYACRCDLARYCLLYLYGGLYVDLNVYFLTKLADLESMEFYAFRDLPYLSKHYWAVHTSIIYTKPESKIARCAIDLVVDNCKNEYYGIDALDVTSTTVLGRSVVLSSHNSPLVNTQGQLDYFPKNILPNRKVKEIERVGYDKENLFGFITDDDVPIALRKPTSGGDISSLGFSKTNNYVELWRNRNSYDTSIRVDNT